MGLIQAAIGCMPAYRPPRRTDFFRAAPTPTEMQTAAMAQQAVPLRPSPPPPEAAPAIGGSSASTIAYPMDLEQAIRIGLSNSGVVRVLSGGGVGAAEATAYDAEIAEARARIALAAFDPSVTSSLYGNWINQPPEAVFGPGLAEPTRRDEAGYTAALSKPWLTGGETKIGYNPPLGYLYLPEGTSGFNPLYESNLEFSLRQPLLRGLGIAANKAPIRVAQLRRDDVVMQTRQSTMASVRSISEAYWDLSASAAALSAIESVVPLLQRVVTIEQERMNAQRSVRADVAKVQSQLHAVTQQAVAARSDFVQRELRLRNLLGLQPVDGYLIMPTSRPLEAPVAIDTEASAAAALEMRPDVIRQRLAVRAREQELLAAKNQGLPQLDAVGLYRWNGVGERLDESLDQMISTQFADWQTSLTFSMPLGRRAAAGAIRAATLQLAREKAMLQQATHSAVHSVNALAREADYAYRLFAEASARLQANGDWLEGAKIRYENPPPDGDDWLLAATNDYLTALRSQADAAADTQAYLARYNASLARLSEAMGTILDDHGVAWSGDVGPSPQSAPLGERLVAPQSPAANGQPFVAPNRRIAPAPESVPTPVGVPAAPGLRAPLGARTTTPAETFFGPAGPSALGPPPSLVPQAGGGTSSGANMPPVPRATPAETFFGPSPSATPSFPLRP